MGKTPPGGNRAPEVELKKYLYEVLYVSKIFRYLYLGFYFFDDFLLLICIFTQISVLKTGFFLQVHCVSCHYVSLSIDKQREERG